MSKLLPGRRVSPRASASDERSERDQSGHYPASPASSRQSFAGTSLGSAEQTLTRRIWECAGTATPSLATGAGVY